MLGVFVPLLFFHWGEILMKRILFALVIGSCFACAVPAGWFTADAEPTQLRCEYLESPLGVDVLSPRLSWKLEAGNVRGVKQAAYQVLVASSEKLLKEGKVDLWDSGKVESEQSVHVEYAGKPLESLRQYYWKVKVWTAKSEAGGWSKPATWTTGLLKPGDLEDAKWIKSDLQLYEYQKELKKIADHDRETENAMWARAPGIRSKTAGIEEAPAVWLRKEFSASGKNLRSARACVSGLGFYELYINGKKVNDQYINVAPYDYDKAVPYQVHDVTQFLHGGTNAIGVILGNGYFNPVVPSLLREYAADFIDTPRMLLSMVLEYDDGSVQRVVSDETWKFTTSGPIRFNSVRAGETYDARRELGDWSSPGYNMESWKGSIVAEAPTGMLVNQNLPPVRRIAEIPAVSVVKSKEGYRFDIGVEATGWARLKVRGKPGQKIAIKYPGKVSHTLGRYQECQYICRGGGEETYEPRFAFNGYRFVDVSGLDYEPKASDLVGCEVVCDLKSTGQFSCSSPELNKIQEVVLRTILNYNIHIPMDPVREKVGWTQDVQSNFKATACNFDVSRIYKKWQEDFVLSIQADGYVPTVVPGCFDGPTINGPWWGGMIVYNPWQLYNFYGDRRILERSYESMKRYISYLDSIATNNIISWGLGDWMDTTPDCKQGSRPICTTVPYTSTCAYMMYNDMVRKTALLLDKTADATRYAARVEEIRAAINKRFFNTATGVYDKGSQTGHVLALVLGVPEEADRPRVTENLKAQIASDGFHITSGFVGIPILLTYLTEHGMGDLAWRIATRPTYPGWFDMVFTLKNSVLKEDWAGRLVQMPSLAAPIGEWFYRSLGGIRPDAPGFKHVVIQPYTATLDWVKCEYECPYGLIRSDWSKKDGVLTMVVIVPPNTGATVYVPARAAAAVTESGQAIDKVKGVKFLRLENGAAVYEVGSGNYKFQTTFN
jgi:alpha-L-rhamnosidase